MFLSPNKQDLINQQSTDIRGISLKSETKFTLLAVDIANRLTFHSHIDNICRKAASQINALKRLPVHMKKNEKMVLMKSFILSNFNYCPLVWHFCSKTDTDRMERIQKRVLRMVLDDYESDYEALLQKANMSTLRIVRIKTLATEIFKTFHSLNPIYINEILQINPSTARNLRIKNKLVTHRYNSITYDKTVDPQYGIIYPMNTKQQKIFKHSKVFLNNGTAHNAFVIYVNMHPNFISHALYFKLQCTCMFLLAC